MKYNEKLMNAGQEHKARRAVRFPMLLIGCIAVFAAVILLTFLFYHTLEREIYKERAAYMTEISAQVVSTTDTVANAQWNLAAILSNRMRESRISGTAELADWISSEVEVHDQEELYFLVFDNEGNYYDAAGSRARWRGSLMSIQEDSPIRQVEVTTLSTTVGKTDEMVFLLRMETPVVLQNEGVTLTHVAVVRDMDIFYEQFQVPSFEGSGENFFVSSTGTRIYRGKSYSEVIGDVYNVLKPLEVMSFRYGGSYEKLKEIVASQEKCCMEFTDGEKTHYYVTSVPMGINDWSILSVVPSSVVSAQMQHFLNMTLFGMGAIALLVLAAASTAILLIARYRTSQQLLHQQAEMNTALKEAAQTAKEASRAKTVFLSHMSHDIRTPINGIMGMTDIAVRNPDDTARVADCLKKITVSSKHLLSLVNDVLDMSQIESGKVKLEYKPFYVEALLDACYSLMAGQAQERGLSMKKEFSGVEQMVLSGDELRLRQVIINILGNAVKFTPDDGEIVFAACGRDVGGGMSELTLVIRDNGIGMSEDFQQKIFEPFAQAEDGPKSSYRGTGLGMSIVKQFLDLMGGSIELQSAPGQGSTFTVRLRLQNEIPPLRQEHAPDGDVSVLRGLRVLLVEDNELNMEIARYILEECGAAVTEAEDGRKAVDIFKGSPEGSFDVILMDVMMPVMDGLEATRAIRSGNQSDADTIPIIAMTANAYAEDRRAVLEAGMNRHLAKPIESRELLHVLAELCINDRCTE